MIGVNETYRGTYQEVGIEKRDFKFFGMERLNLLPCSGEIFEDSPESWDVESVHHVRLPFTHGCRFTFLNE